MVQRRGKAELCPPSLPFLIFLNFLAARSWCLMMLRNSWLLQQVEIYQWYLVIGIVFGPLHPVDMLFAHDGQPVFVLSAEAKSPIPICVVAVGADEMFRVGHQLPLILGAPVHIHPYTLGMGVEIVVHVLKGFQPCSARDELLIAVGPRWNHVFRSMAMVSGLAAPTSPVCGTSSAPPARLSARCCYGEGRGCSRFPVRPRCGCIRRGRSGWPNSACDWHARQQIPDDLGVAVRIIRRKKLSLSATSVFFLYYAALLHEQIDVWSWTPPWPWIPLKITRSRQTMAQTMKAMPAW